MNIPFWNFLKKKECNLGLLTLIYLINDCVMRKVALLAAENVAFLLQNFIKASVILIPSG